MSLQHYIVCNLIWIFVNLILAGGTFWFEKTKHIAIGSLFAISFCLSVPLWIYFALGNIMVMSGGFHF